MFRLARTAMTPFLTQRLVFNGIPTNTDAKPKPPPRKDIYFGRLLGNHAGLALRQDQNTRCQFDGRCCASQVPEHDKDFMKRILVAVSG